jgi:membrane-bound ClpP family serine protease
MIQRQFARSLQDYKKVDIMNITEREHDSVTVFVLDGRVDSDGAVELDQALQTATSEGKYHMILDISAYGTSTAPDYVPGPIS